MSLSILNIHYSSPSFPHNLSKLHHSTADIIFLTGKFPRVREDLERERERERDIILQDLDMTIRHTDARVGDNYKPWLWSSHGAEATLTHHVLAWIILLSPPSLTNTTPPLTMSKLLEIY